MGLHSYLQVIPHCCPLGIMKNHANGPLKNILLSPVCGKAAEHANWFRLSVQHYHNLFFFLNWQQKQPWRSLWSITSLETEASVFSSNVQYRFYKKNCKTCKITGWVLQCFNALHGCYVMVLVFRIYSIYFQQITHTTFQPSFVHWSLN